MGSIGAVLDAWDEWGSIGAVLDAWDEWGSIGAVLDAWDEWGSIGAVLDAWDEWGSIDAVLDVCSALVGFCRRVLVDFCWWCGYTKGTYLGTFWAVRLSDPHMVVCKYGGEEPGCCVRVFVIFICSYDPFDRGRMLYTIRNMCVEVPELEYDDGVRTIFLNTKGLDDDVSEELMELLRFMEDTREVNAVNDVLREMQEMVDIVKEDGKVTVAYMKSFEIEQMWIKQGIEQGIKQGINQGIEQGRKEERVNTLREKERADRLERELRKLRRGRKKV